MKMFFGLMFLLLTCVAWTLPLFAEATGIETQAIAHLIDYIKNSPHKFIRNGELNDSDSAAKHISSKYDHYKKEISTAEEFITRCASSSMMTGKPYLVRFEDGSEQSVALWLGEELTRFRKGVGVQPGQSPESRK